MSWDELCQTLVKLHVHTKSLTIMGEELNEELKTNFQIVQQWSYALEHFMRAQGLHVGLDLKLNSEEQEKNKDKIIENNLKSAINHEYRAFWDAADMVSVSYRNQIEKLLKPYSIECIKSAIPDWYSQRKIEIDKINKNISRLREEKDSANTIHQKLQEADEYRKHIDYLDESYRKVLDAVSTMDDLKRKSLLEIMAKYIVSFFIGILIGYVVSFLT